VLQKSEKEGRNEFNIDYDEMNPFKYALDAYQILIIYESYVYILLCLVWTVTL
jgi:hypothetical protein